MPKIYNDDDDDGDDDDNDDYDVFSLFQRIMVDQGEWGWECNQLR